MLLQQERCGRRTADELVHDPLVLHETEQFSQLGIFSPRSLDDWDIIVFVVPNDLSRRSGSWVIVVVKVRLVQ